jgi:SAM-dependent methyltransferase
MTAPRQPEIKGVPVSKSPSLLSRRRRRANVVAPAGKRIVLHVGCGVLHPLSLHESFRTPEWHEVRLDIDPAVQPDIVASIVDMSPVPPASVDAVWSHHNIEHVSAHEVPQVLKEFFRVLRPGGGVLLATPDLQGVAEAIAKDRLEDALYRSPAGNVSPLDVVYGYGSEIARGRDYMTHRTGFTLRTLTQRLTRAGFVEVHVERSRGYALWATGYRPAG